ncbi:DNA mismatch repair endonuclease MutL, partial [bacterium]
MADRIRILEASLAAKIAAGEVVDRPASVVKELIENSIDAGAKSIAVFIVEGGKRMIRVVDDGVGMSRSDAQAAFQRHATSKVSCEEDLERIETLGFRGEALASISAVSRVRLRTKECGALTGVSVIVEGGGEARLDDDGVPEGASVEVKDIFYNLPARLKFLRSADSEYGRVLDVFKKAALINPGISFSLMHGSSSSRGIYVVSGTLAERVAGLFPEYKATDFTEARSPVVNGLIASHEVSFSTTKCLYVYVNKRPVKDRSINSAILDGYGTILDRGRYPFAVLNITIAPEDVDVNIHPAKTEVRFKSQRYVYDAVKAAVRRALGMEVGAVSQAWQTRPVDLRPVNPVVYYSEGKADQQKNFYANEPVAVYGAEPRLFQGDVADTADAGFSTDVKTPELA